MSTRQKVKLGVIGCGDVSIGYYFPEIVSLVEENKADLIAVCDISEERAKRVKEKFKAKEYYLKYDEMLRRADIEAVINLTNISQHVKVSLAAIKMKKHVFSEKPIAIKLQDANVLIEEAKRVNVKLVCAPAITLAPRNQWVKEIVRKGGIGKACFVRAHGSHGGPADFDDFITDPTWFYKEGGGPDFDMAIYQLHLLTDIIGPAKKVFTFRGIAIPEVIIRSGIAKGKKIKVETADNTMFLLDFGEARFGVIDGSYCMKAVKGPSVEFYGSEGTIYLADWRDETVPPIEAYIEKKELGLRGWINPFPVPARRSFPITPMRLGDGVRHFVECINQNTQPLLSGEHARHVLEIILKGRESAKRGQAMDLTTTF